jgi:hypothetical protein
LDFGNPRSGSVVVCQLVGVSDEFNGLVAMASQRPLEQEALPTMITSEPSAVVSA